MSWRQEDGPPPNQIPPELRAEFDKSLIVMGGDMVDGPRFFPIGRTIKDEEFLELKRQVDMEILHWARMYEGHWPRLPEPERHERLQPKPRVSRYT